MEIQELAKRIHKFQKERFSKYSSELTSELIFTHLVEEIGEIAREIFSKSSKMRECDFKKIKEEIAQAILDLLVLSELHEVDLKKEIELKISNMDRRWQPRN